MIAIVIPITILLVVMVLFWCYVVKKRLYRFRPRDAQNVSRTTGDEHRVNAEQIPEEDLATDNTDLEHPDSTDEQLNSASSETNQQVLSVHLAGACAASHHLPPQVGSTFLLTTKMRMK